MTTHPDSVEKGVRVAVAEWLDSYSASNRFVDGVRVATSEWLDSYTMCNLFEAGVQAAVSDWLSVHGPTLIAAIASATGGDDGTGLSCDDLGQPTALRNES